MGGRFRRLAAGAARWSLKVFASVLLGAIVVGAGGLALGLLSDNVGALQAFRIGALAGAGFGAIVAFTPRERAGDRREYRPTGRMGDQGRGP